MAAKTLFDPKNMPFKFVGRSGLKVSALSYGGWLTLGGTQDQEKTTELIKAAFEAGINFFDTAEAYNHGRSEEVMGQAFKTLGYDRDELVVATKVFFGTGRKHPNQNGLSRKHIIEGTKASLKRLQMDHVDILLAHRPDFGTPMDEIVRAMTYLVDNGLTHYWGTSEWSAVQLQEAYAIAERHHLVGPTIEQPQYHMLERAKLEGEYMPIFQQYGLGTMIWSPLASGLLTGKYNEGIPKGSRFDNHSDFFKTRIEELQSDAGKAKIEKVRKLKGVADKLGCSQAALALAWCAKNPNVSSVILGATSVQQLEENFGAIPIIEKLDSKIMEEIDGILANKPAAPATFGRARD